MAEQNPRNTPFEREISKWERKGLSRGDAIQKAVAKWPTSRHMTCIVYSREHRKMYTELAKALIKRGIAIDYEYTSKEETRSYGSDEARFTITIKDSTTGIPRDLESQVYDKYNVYPDCYDDEFRGKYETNPRQSNAAPTTDPSSQVLVAEQNPRKTPTQREVRDLIEAGKVTAATVPTMTWGGKTVHRRKWTRIRPGLYVRLLGEWEISIEQCNDDSECYDPDDRGTWQVRWEPIDLREGVSVSDSTGWGEFRSYKQARDWAEHEFKDRPVREENPRSRKQSNPAPTTDLIRRLKF